MFVDSVEIDVIAGNGGHGCVSFRTEKFIPKGGPDGGNGGNGGDIIAVSDPNLSTLLDFRYRRVSKAEHGKQGGGGRKSGRSGSDVRLRVPVGTIIRDLESEQIIADLDSPGSEIVIARGGRGGYGNEHYKSATNQSPRTAQDGQPGQRRKLGLELKLLADVGLVGMPNAGKSTILASLSAARPKVADYPFTTLIPNLGIVSLREFKSCVMADIPGLIKGASLGKGLGIQFLKHIQRTKVLVYVIDIAEPDIITTRAELESELADFDSALPNRPTITVITKTDTVTESDLKKFSKKLPGDYIYISAVAGKGVKLFLQTMEQKLDRV